MKKANDLKQIKELLEIVKHKVDTMEFRRTGESASASLHLLHLMKDQQSVMNEKLDAISKDLNDPKTGLKRINEKTEALWDQVEKIILGTEEVQETLDSHTVSLKRIESKMEQITDNTKKLDKRVKTTKTELGIVPPPELTLYDG